MERFQTHEWNEYDKYLGMIILTEEDIKNEVGLRGCGYEILVIPSKYEETDNEFVNMFKTVIEHRNCRVIYV